MSKVLISLAEKPMLNKLRQGVRVDSDEFNSLVKEFCLKVVKDEEVYNTIREYDLTPSDLETIYLAMARAYPDKCLDVGGPLLVATLPFMEPLRLASIARMANSNQDNGFTREMALRAAARDVADWIYDAHAAASQVMLISMASAKNNDEPEGCIQKIIVYAIAVGSMFLLVKLFSC